ncbi:MAG: hypothetical protein WC341_15150, partial [Bacteroidales bacterium]
MIFIIKPPAYSQVALSEWAIHTGNSGCDIVNATTCDSAGNLYLTGSLSDTLSKTVSDNAALNFMKYLFLSKYDTTGKLTWAKSISGINPEYGSLLTINSEDKLIVACGSSQVKKGKKTNPKKYTFYLSCLDTSGTGLWTVQFTGTNIDYLTSITISKKNNDILLGGYFYDTLTIQDKQLVSNGKADAFLLCFHSDGKLRYSFSFGGKDDDRINALLARDDGSLILAGNHQRKITLPDNLVLENTSLHYKGVFLATLDETGKMVKAKNFCTGKNVQVVALAGHGNNVYFACNFSDYLTFENQNIASAGSEDICIFSLGTDFSLKWNKQIGSLRNDRVSSMVENENEIIFSGSFSDTLSIGNLLLHSTGIGNDIFVASLNKVGDILWVKQMGGNADDYPKTLTLSPQKYIYLSGSFRKQMDISGRMIFSSGEEDIFTVRIEHCNAKMPHFRNPEVLCGGSSLTLDAGNGFISYKWNNGESREQTFMIQKGGNYPLELQNKNGCLINDTVHVLEVTPPEISLGNDTTISGEQWLYLHPEGEYAAWEWSNGAKDSVIILKADECFEGPNYIWVNVTNTNGCTGYAGLTVNVIKNVTNTVDRELAEACTLFPNPNNSQFTLYLAKDYDRVEIIIHDPLGKNVYRQVITNH